MCRAPPKPSPTPSPQPVICIYCGSSVHRSMECSNRPRDNREEGRVPSPASSRYSRDKQRKSAAASGESSQRSNGKSRNNEKPRTSGKNLHRDLQQADNITNSHNAPHRANQIIIVFLTGITGIKISQDRQDSMKSRIKCILLITLPLHLHFLQALTCLVALSCNLQKHNHVLLRFL